MKSPARSNHSNHMRSELGLARLQEMAQSVIETAEQPKTQIQLHSAHRISSSAAAVFIQLLWSDVIAHLHQGIMDPDGQLRGHVHVGCAL